MNAKEDLIRALYQLVGNKKYMRGIEDVIKKMDLTKVEEQDIRLLCHDIRNQITISQSKKPWG